MKKILLVLLFCNCCTTALFPQQKDKLQPDPEIQRFNQLRDSLYRAGLARDSAFREQLDQSLRKIHQDIAVSKQKEVEQATQEVLQRHEKEYKTKKRTIVWASAAFFLALVVVRMLFKRQKAKK